MHRITRREWLKQGAIVAGATALGAPRLLANHRAAERGCTLSYSTYALKGMPVERAVRVIAEDGFDGVELAVATGYDAEPKNMSADRRSALRGLLAESKLKLTALMEHLYPAEDDAQHKVDLERLSQVMRLGADLGGVPVVQTVLGGGTWEEKRELFLKRLPDWVAVAESAGVTLAIKPHRGGAMSRPSEAIWLILELGEPKNLRMVYDYSHYAFRGMPLEETVREAVPYTAHVAVKDAVEQGDKVIFQLPGHSGTFDYARLLRLLHEGGYRGDVCCEVSSMVSGAAGYDPLAAAKECEKNMARAFEDAMVPRG